MQLIRHAVLAGLALCAAFSACAADAVANVENSVVKIFTTSRGPDLLRPWGKSAPRESTGSGVVIDGKRILTNAHVVAYASQVQVQGNQSGEKIGARVEFIAPGIDLAVLKLEDESFFDSRPPVKRAAKLPAVKDGVMAYGYPTGGTSLSITKGIVSRIEFVSYSFPTQGLRIQIDAAINPGNSGGPALSGDEMMGLAFARLGAGDNIGYIIPNEEIDLFLADIADGRYDGKPGLFEGAQVLQNPALRAYAKVPKGVAGLLVVTPQPTPGTPLKPMDVLTHIGDVQIDDEGMVRIGDNLRVRSGYLVQQLARNGSVPVQVLRDGKQLALKLPVVVQPDLLIPGSLNGEFPPYFLYGPLVFTTPTADRLTALGVSMPAAMAQARMGSPLLTRLRDRPDFAGQQLVMVSSPLQSHKLARGYGSPILRVLASVNGTPVKNLAHLVELLRDASGEFVAFRFVGEGQELLVLPRAEVADATEAIMNDNGIRAQGSAELLKVWSNR
ncbi:S1C family serine protease [Roseateles sp. LYH14W]|uniref:Trypsin-like peptidase domain-containing protein n=1 Tax=Pelomonas parva TaxID=3299032 RepID=A0ABW7F292_9BURK